VDALRVIKAIFFDVDFTLIFPGPTFQAEGYRRACAAHGIEVDPAKFEEATAASSFILDEVEDQIYRHDIFIHYTASIIEHMGGRGANVGGGEEGPGGANTHRRNPGRSGVELFFYLDNPRVVGRKHPREQQDSVGGRARLVDEKNIFFCRNQKKKK
jgi:hypothetical protein